MPTRQSVDQPRLSIIDEDSDALHPLPSSPNTTSHRPFSRRWRDKPPAANYDHSPPTYSVWDISGPRGERLMDMRNNKYIVRRGGWKRLFLAFLIIAVIAIALGVGLGVGLQKRSHTINSAPSSSSSPNGTGPYPIGNHSLVTKLDVVSTDCTANPATWLCYPYVTFATDPAKSNATFSWIIQGTPSNLTISSSYNPFAISFSNVSLSKDDAGTENERYYFSTTVDQLVVPDEPITEDNSRAACWYNNTELTAALYTKRASSNLTSTMNNTSLDPASESSAVWPHAIEINQTIHGGSNTPNCYELKNGGLGSRITTDLPAQPTTRLCECIWRNFAL